MHTYLPPFLPQEITQELAHALETFQEDAPHTETERTLIQIGKGLWPYTRAFSVIARDVEDGSSTDYLLSFLSRPLKNWYTAFQSHGGTFEDLQKSAQRRELLALRTGDRPTP
jgi:dihydroorotase